MCARRERGAPSPRGRRLLCPRPWGLAGFPPHLGVRLWPPPRPRSRHARGPVAPVSRHELDGAFVFP